MEDKTFSRKNNLHFCPFSDLIALFGAINISGTGRIDKDEFADLFYHLDLAVSDEYLLTLFNAADKDGKQ